MLFKNLFVYRLPADWSWTAGDLEMRLGGHLLRPCGHFDMLTRGWQPVTKGGRLLHTVGQHHMLSLGTNQKLLPASIIRQVAEERAEAQATEQGFPVGRKQMRDIKAQVADELRARALTRRTTTRAWIDSRNGWFVIDAAGAPRAESLLETLVATLDSFVPAPLEGARSPHAFMTSWLMQGDAPFKFAIDDDLELQAADETKSCIRYVRHPLDGKDIRSHLAAGKHPTRMGLTWNGRVSFILTDKLCLKRIEFLEVGKDQTDAEEVDPAEQFDIDFAVMAGELSALLTDLAHIIESPQASENMAAQCKVA
ncbi:MAG TPA: recombination-associated protein RdgC [Steroidobacteraceae bacterium]|nr:recombination-associated protein RdgC [Steroidobacteraceae bacterium]